MTTKIGYDYEFLQQFCKENGIVLTYKNLYYCFTKLPRNITIHFHLHIFL